VRRRGNLDASSTKIHSIMVESMRTAAYFGKAYRGTMRRGGAGGAVRIVAAEFIRKPAICVRELRGGESRRWPDKRSKACRQFPAASAGVL